MSVNWISKGATAIASGWDGADSNTPGLRQGIVSAFGLVAVGILVLPMAMPDRDDAGPAAQASQAAHAERAFMIGGYGGISATQPSAVTIKNGQKTDMTIKDFSWIGRPFKAPVYYGVRIVNWGPHTAIGTMLDFTHAKAIANKNDVATFLGQHNGKALPSKAKISDVFRHLEFSHGHNMLTLNGLLRIMPFLGKVRPYIGAGAGVSLPHTEIGFRGSKKRTYEYQFAGFVGQVLTGVEIPIGRTSLFVEYKFTYAPYTVPLSHEPYGWLLVTDLWRQFSAWWRAETPPGGVLKTTLASHHGIGGVLIRIGRRSGAPANP